jgi:alcohol dehydrogenase
VSSLADRTWELQLRGRIRFGAGAVETLPELVAAAAVHAGDTGAVPSGAARPRAFIVTDPGVVASGVIERVRRVLLVAGIDVGLYAAVEPNPGSTSVTRGSAALTAFGLAGTVVVPVGGGSSMDSAKAISLHAANGGNVLALGYHREDLMPGGPVIAVPTTAGTGAETNTYGVITDEAAGRKGYVGHPSLLPLWSVLDPELTVGLPPGATAATGVDAMTHSLESLLSRHPNPFAEALALQVIRTVREWLPRAVADGSDLEARSQLLMASHLAGIGQQSGTGVGLVHALGHAIGTRGRLPHGLALATVLPEVMAFYADEPGLRDRELALVGVAIGAASPTESPATGAIAAIGAMRGFLSELGLRPTLRSLGFDEALLDVVAQDAIDDPAIDNSPRLPTLDQARAILGSVAG